MAKAKLKEHLINTEWCKGCGICVSFCPKRVLALDDKDKARAGAVENCIAYKLCELRCPDLAIEVVTAVASAVNTEIRLGIRSTRGGPLTCKEASDSSRATRPASWAPFTPGWNFSPATPSLPRRRSPSCSPPACRPGGRSSSSLLAMNPLVSLESIMKLLEEKFTSAFLDMNRKALDLGYALGNEMKA